MKKYILILSIILLKQISGSSSKLSRESHRRASNSAIDKPNLDKDGYLILDKPTKKEIAQHAKMTHIISESITRTQDFGPKRKSSLLETKHTITKIMDSILGKPNQQEEKIIIVKKHHTPPTPEVSRTRKLITEDKDIQKADAAIKLTQGKIEKLEKTLQTNIPIRKTTKQNNGKPRSSISTITPVKSKNPPRTDSMDSGIDSPVNKNKAASPKNILDWHTSYV